MYNTLASLAYSAHRALVLQFGCYSLDIYTKRWIPYVSYKKYNTLASLAHSAQRADVTV